MSLAPHHIPVLLADLVLIIVVARLLGGTATRLGQPAVIGEIVGGILLGPTLLGHYSTTVFPNAVRPTLSDAANVGVCVFMFGIGLELDHRLLRGQARTAATVALGAIAVPFVLGLLLALRLLAHHPTAHHAGFVLFVGTAMSVTAFPVLARILADKQLLRTPIGSLAMACAALGDVLAWTLLVVSIALARANGHPMRLLWVVPYLMVMIGVVRPAAARHARRQTNDTSRAAAVLVLLAVAVGLGASAVATDRMGLHQIFGAFLFGVNMPREGLAAVRERVLPRIADASALLLLPVFFIVAGLKVDLRHLDGTDLGELMLIMLVAIGGKLFGGFGAARFLGVSRRHSAVLAVLLDTRGLTELIVLSVGVQAGVLDAELNSLMVVMAVVTTALTGVLLRWVYPPDRVRLDAERASADHPWIRQEPMP